MPFGQWQSQAQSLTKVINFGKELEDVIKISLGYTFTRILYNKADGAVSMRYPHRNMLTIGITYCIVDDFLQTVNQVFLVGIDTEVIRNVSLGLLSFLKINMYEDLVSHKASILQNPIIRALGGDPSGLIPVPEGLADYDFDDTYDDDDFTLHETLKAFGGKQ